MSADPLRVACIGMGWWSDVLADAIQRSGKLKIAACYTRSEDKRRAFAAKYGCRAAPSYEAILEDRAIEAIVNTTPNDAHLETTRAAAAAGMPGGVMLQIGIHYADVLEYLIGPVKAVSGRFAQLVLPGDNPDVASLVLEHENGALSTLNASYASASEYYLMNIYGKEASAYYDMHQGLRLLKRGGERPSSVPCAKNDAFVEELEEFAKAVRGEGRPEMSGEAATASLAVIRAGIVSAREGRRVEVAEMLSKD